VKRSRHLQKFSKKDRKIRKNRILVDGEEGLWGLNSALFSNAFSQYAARSTQYEMNLAGNSFLTDWLCFAQLGFLKRLCLGFRA